MSNVRGKLVRGVAGVSAIQLALRVVDIVLLAVFARLLSPQDFGIVAAAYIFIEFAKLFVELGVGPTLIQLPDLTRREVRTAFGVVIINAILFFALFQLGAPFAAALIAIPEATDALRALAFLFLIQAIGIVPENLLARRMRSLSVAGAQAAGKVLGMAIVAVGLAFSGYGYWALVWGALVEAGVRAATLFAIARPPIAPLLHRPSIARLLGRGVGFSVSRVLNFAALQGDNLVAGRMLGAEALGVYSRAFRLISIPADLYSQIAERLIFPAMASMQDDPRRLKAAFVSGTSLTATIGLSMSLGLYLLGESVILVLLGDQWRAVIVPFTVLALAGYFRLGAKISGSLLRATASMRALIGSQLFYAVSVVGLGVLAAPYGVGALASATAIAGMMHYLLITALAATRTHTSLRELWAAHLPGLALAAVFGATLAGALWLMDGAAAPAWGELLVGSALSLAMGIALMAAPSKALLGEPACAAIQSLRSNVAERFQRRSVQ